MEWSLPDRYPKIPQAGALRTYFKMPGGSLSNGKLEKWCVYYEPCFTPRRLICPFYSLCCLLPWLLSYMYQMQWYSAVALQHKTGGFKRSAIVYYAAQSKYTILNLETQTCNSQWLFSGWPKILHLYLWPKEHIWRIIKTNVFLYNRNRMLELFIEKSSRIHQRKGSAHWKVGKSEVECFKETQLTQDLSVCVFLSFVHPMMFIKFPLQTTSDEIWHCIALSASQLTSFPDCSGHVSTEKHWGWIT